MTPPDTRPDPHPKLTGLLAAEPDLVDRLFDYLLTELPALVQNRSELQDVAAALREEFGGERVYVRSPREIKSQQIAQRVLALFNGRNATEVARTLGIGRATVYRVLKRPGVR